MLISTKSSERLTAMQRLLHDNGWTKGSMHDYKGRCLLGAVLFVHDRYATPVAWADPLVREDLQWLHEAAALKESCDCGGCMTGHARAERLMAWNDTPERTFIDVIGAFDRAIAGARAAEAIEAPAAGEPPPVTIRTYMPSFKSESYVVRYTTWAPLQVAKIVVEEEKELELVGA